MRSAAATRKEPAFQFADDSLSGSAAPERMAFGHSVNAVGDEAVRAVRTLAPCSPAGVLRQTTAAVAKSISVSK